MVDKRNMKIVFLGESGVGKTCIISRYTTNTFHYKGPTEHANNKGRTLTSPDGSCVIYMVIWDTAGQEMYRSICPFYYRDADAVVLVYDITKESSFKELESWISEIKKNGKADMLMTIAGNKSDMVNEEVVSVAEGKNFAESNKSSFFLVSAKENLNLDEMFLDIGLRKFPHMREAFGKEGIKYFL